MFAIAALNFACWALITPLFQVPDEVDHFAYTQSLVERGEAPSRNPGSPLARWSSAENTALEDMSFFTDHQVGDSAVPWAPAQEGRYLRQVAATHPPAGNGGGNETAATHGPIYYAALAPAYVLAGSSPLAQLTLMRIASGLIGALAVLFTFLLVRELAPGRPWLAVLAALLVAYEPMYGFISGAVNNDVGVNAAAAALTYLLLRMVRRGVTLPWGLLTGGLLILLPIIKETGYSLYPIAAIALAMTLWRHHRRRAELLGYVGLALGALAVHELQLHLAGTFHPVEATAAAGRVTATASVGLAREHPLGFLAYLWELFLPRLSFMAPHFVGVGYPAYTIFVKRGWGAFGWYDVFYPGWVYRAIVAAMLLVALLGLAATLREWPFVRRNLFEFVLLLLTPLAVMAAFEADGRCAARGIPRHPESGLLLQVDDAVLANMYDHLVRQSPEHYREWAELRVDALNHALEGIPEDRIRYHICFGSWHVPHIADAPLEEIVDFILKVRAGAYSIEAANPRHEHEWRVWETRKLPDGKILIPGVVTHHTMTVEHPRLVADRIIRFARIVGRENVIAGTDCGFAQTETLQRVPPDGDVGKIRSPGRRRASGERGALAVGDLDRAGGANAIRGVAGAGRPRTRPGGSPGPLRSPGTRICRAQFY